MMNFHKGGLLIAATCLATSVHAADINWSGFGTLGVGQTLNNSDQLYRANGLVPENGTLDDKLNFDALSVVALQANADLGNHLSATVQIKATGSDNWDTDVSWAYLTYDLHPTLRAQAGRKILPIYKYTDSIDVGYTYHWIRPPADVYANPISRYDGANLIYQDFFGDWEINTNVLFGRNNDDEKAFASGPVSYRVWGGTAEATLDWMSFRLAGIIYEDLELSDFDPITTEYYGAAVQLQPGNWLVIAEYTYYTTDSPDVFGPGTKFLNDMDAAWYVSAAYNMGKWTPHLTYSQFDFKDEGSNIPAVAGGPGQVAEANTIIAGVRYDFHPAASLKMEYHLRDDDTTVGGQPTTLLDNPSGKTDVVQLAIDFIF
jgi:predicted porin